MKTNNKDGIANKKNLEKINNKPNFKPTNQAKLVENTLKNKLDLNEVKKNLKSVPKLNKPVSVAANSQKNFIHDQKKNDKNLKKNITKLKSIPNKLNSTKYKFSKILSFDFKSFFLNLIEYFFISFYFYLLSKNFFDLFLNHLIYLIYGKSFNFEYFLVSLLGIIQSCYFFYNINSYFAKKEENLKNDLLNNILALVLQLNFFFIIGLIQFFNHMTIWDHRFKLYSPLYEFELIKYIIDIIFLVLIISLLSFKYIKLKHKMAKDSIDF